MFGTNERHFSSKLQKLKKIYYESCRRGSWKEFKHKKEEETFRRLWGQSSSFETKRNKSSSINFTAKWTQNFIRFINLTSSKIEAIEADIELHGTVYLKIVNTFLDRSSFGRIFSAILYHQEVSTERNGMNWNLKHGPKTT